MSISLDNTPVFCDLLISSTISSFVTQKRFRKDISVRQLKENLELLTGVLSTVMRLELYDKSDKLISLLDIDEALLGNYVTENEMRLHVISKGNERIGEFEDLSRVEKYEMSDEDYAMRTDSVRAFKEKMKLGRFKEVSEEEQAQKNEEERIKNEKEAEAAALIAVGNRCQVTTTGQPTKRGTVMFVGQTSFKPGIWVGVKYDEPFGKNDGSVAGKRYFECLPKYGGFVKPQDVTVGDFPELDELDDMDEL